MDDRKPGLIPDNEALRETIKTGLEIEKAGIEAEKHGPVRVPEISGDASALCSGKLLPCAWDEQMK